MYEEAKRYEGIHNIGYDPARAHLERLTYEERARKTEREARIRAEEKQVKEIRDNRRQAGAQKSTGEPREVGATGHRAEGNLPMSTRTLRFLGIMN